MSERGKQHYLIFYKKYDEVLRRWLHDELAGEDAMAMNGNDNWNGCRITSSMTRR